MVFRLFFAIFAGMKKLWLILAMVMQLSVVRAEIKITVLSDIHVMSPELVVKDGKAWQDFLAQKTGDARFEQATV